jgi:hypothetical protein
MSNHFTGLSLGPPLGDQRLDLCDLYAFQSPADRNRTVIILNANPNADALHPDAIYRLNMYSQTRRAAGKLLISSLRRARSRAHPKPWEQRLSLPARSLSPPRRTS